MNYDNMKEGLEIDKLVGTALGGLHAEYVKLHITKEYSSSNYYAQVVIDWMIKQRGWTVVTTQGKSGVMVCIQRWNGYDHDGDVAGWAETMPLAVCRAALKALEVK